MLTGDFIFIFLLVSALLFVGIGVLLHEKRSFTAKYFFVLILFMAIWLSSNFASNYLKTEILAIYANRLIFTATTLAIWQLLIFTKNYPERANIIEKKTYWALFIPTLLTALLGISPYVVTGAVIKDNYSEVIFGPGVAIYLTHLVFFLILYVRTLFIKNKSLHGIDKAKLQYLFTGLTISIIGIITTNLVLPLLFNNFVFTNIGPAFLLLFVGFTAFSIIEIRLTGIRNLLFQITNLLIVGLLPVGAFYITSTLLSILPDNPYLAVLDFALIFVVMTASFLITSRGIIVVRKYLQGDLIANNNEIEKIKSTFLSRISTELDITKLSKYTCDVIKNTIGVSDTSVTLLDIDEKIVVSHFSEGFRRNKFSPDSLLTFTSDWKSLHVGYVLVLDELEHQERSILSKLDSSGLEYMKAHKLAVMIALNGSAQTHGFILIGEKPNYNAFTTEEIDFLTTVISNNASIAISRALLFERQKNFNSELNNKVRLRTKELETAKVALEDKNLQLKNAFHELKTLDNAKSEFISIASHQLRTPISIIKGYLSMIKEGDFGAMSDEQLVAISKAAENIQQLNDIVEDILNASRIEKGKLAVSPEDTEIIELVRNVIDQLSQKAEKKNLTLTYKEQLKSFIAHVDRNKIYEVVMNLVDNAINYTKAGSISVSTAVTEKKDLIIAVKDSGIGIPAEFRDKIFQRFSRSENAKAIRPDGTGIGLYVVKSFIEAHGGKIWFESELNKGTTFFVEIPQNYFVDLPQTTDPSKQ